MAKLMTPMYRIIMRKKRRSDRGFIPNPLSADCDLIIYQSTKKVYEAGYLYRIHP